jgi:hypothetical protein
MECFGCFHWKDFNNLNDGRNWCFIAEIAADVEQAEWGVCRLLHVEHFWEECAA